MRLSARPHALADADEAGVFVTPLRFGPSGPVITQILDSDGVATIIAGSVATQTIHGFLIEFDRDVSADGGASGASSVLNPSNWLLTHDGQDISDRIEGIEYEPFDYDGYQPSFIRATVQLDSQLLDGDYVLSLSDAIVDFRGDRLGGEPDLTARIESFELAYRMQTEAAELVDFSQETAETHRLYGLDNEASRSFGGKCLMARRLVERGVRFVQVYVTASGTPTPTWPATIRHIVPPPMYQSMACCQTSSAAGSSIRRS